LLSLLGKSYHHNCYEATACENKFAHAADVKITVSVSLSWRVSFDAIEYLAFLLAFHIDSKEISPVQTIFYHH
jgi:hypothetical protein